MKKKIVVLLIGVTPHDKIIIKFSITLLSNISNPLLFRG